MNKKIQSVNVNNKLVTIDISELIKKENIYFNATEIAKQFGKDIRDYISSKQFNEYVNAIIEVKSNCGNLPQLKIDNLIITKTGRYGGTWLHNYIAVDFARWCDAVFAVYLDTWIIEKLNEEKQRKIDRAIARLEYPDLTDAIKEFLTTGKDSDKWLYSNEADLINKIVLGCKSKRFCELNGIDRVFLRDNLTTGQINLINQLQKFDTGLIQANISYNDRKEKLAIRYAQLIAKLLN